jgi:hypothetical protein
MSISHGILSIELCLDSQLVIRQLNGRYRVRDPTLLLSIPTGTSFRTTI